MDPWYLFVTAFAVGLSGAAAPGPLTAVAVREASRGGFWRGWAVSLGHLLPEALLVLALVYGLGELFARPRVMAFLAAVGGLVLFWMAWGMAMQARHAPLPGPGGEDGGPSRGAVWAGAGATLSNPYWFLWWGTVGAGYVAFARGQGWAGLSLFFAGHCLADVAWLGLVAGVAATGRRFLSAGLYRVLLLFLGVLLALFAGYFVWAGWRWWAG